jgi:hypothetical protein
MAQTLVSLLVHVIFSTRNRERRLRSRGEEKTVKGMMIRVSVRKLVSPLPPISCLRGGATRGPSWRASRLCGRSSCGENKIRSRKGAKLAKEQGDQTLLLAQLPLPGWTDALAPCISATWTAILRGAGNMSHQHFLRTQHIPGNSAQRYLQPATPWRVRLTGTSTDVDVNKSLTGGTLHKRPGKVW